MKNLNYLLLIFIFSGCQKIIHEQDFKISKIGNVDEMNLAINGLYARLEQYINNHNPAPQYLADDMKYGGFTKYIDGGNGIATDNWKCLYNIITSANNIIVQVQNTVNIKTEMKAGLGEAYLLRAYAYFSLVRIFGAVPIVNNIEVNSALSKSSIQDVYAFIESNLLKAAAYLPVNKSMARVPNQSPVSGSANAMLAEVYLTMGGYPLLDNSKYIKAIQVAKNVMDSANVYGFTLLPDYANLWDSQHVLNNEVLFGLFFSMQGYKLVHWGNDEYNSGTAYENTISNGTGNGYTGASIDSGFGTPPNDILFFPIYPGDIFFNNFPESYRKEVTFQTTYLTGTTTTIYNPDSTSYLIVDSFKRIKAFQYNSNVFYKKFGNYIKYDSLSVLIEFHNRVWDTIVGGHHYYYYELDSTKGRIGRNYYMNMGQPLYIYRYAHTLLTYAEAKARSGQLDASAYEAVNMVRRRANKADINSPSKYDLQPGLSATQFADSVVQERAWEFCGEEEGRWYDLLRLEMIEQLPKLKTYPLPPTPIPVFTKSDYFEALPSGDKALDPNLK